jgi:MoxR-like ATPase
MTDQENEFHNPADSPLMNDRFITAVSKVKAELAKVLVGQEQMADLLLAGLFCNGHVLIEGVPGVAKTLTVNLLSRALSLTFSRVQFTPDLMPADVTGTSIFKMQDSSFEFRQGPVFANLVLIDEINRAPAKTQAALFEVMEEQQVTSDGITHPLPQPFMVLATQNPIEQEGTYKLPEAQQDRFLFRIKVDYPGPDLEFQMLQRFSADFKQNVVQTVQAVMGPDEIAYCRSTVEKVHIEDQLLRYIALTIDATRRHPDIFLGASPRAGLAIMKAAKAIAAMSGRDFATPDDIRQVAFPVLNHRLILRPESEMDGIEMKDVITQIFSEVEVPR